MRESIIRVPSLAIVWTLCCLSAVLVSARSRADARPGRYVVRPSTVYDTKTKLTWQQQVAPSPLSYAEAQTYCTTLTLNSLNWRVPSLKELETLVDESRVNPAIDRSAFPDTPGKFFWSSATVTSFPGSGWVVDFNRGGDNFVDVSFTEQVRCVHSG